MVSGPSMEPTLHDGETVIIRKALANQYYHRGDIAVIAPSKQADTYLIKRIIAIGGDTVTIQDGKVFVNGKAVNEVYLTQDHFLLRAMKRKSAFPRAVLPFRRQS